MPAAPARPEETRAFAGVRAAMLALLVATGAAALVLAVTVPYHATDAFVFGSWSRRIADTGAVHFPDVGNSFLARPLFLVTQGWLWHVFGVHEWIGRLESLAFGALLVVALMALARGLAPAALAAVVLLAVPEFAQNAFSGLTDVPGAALTAAAAAVLWRRPEGRWRAVALAALACAAVLAKSTMLPAVAGLGLAHLIGARATLSRRLVWGGLPLAAGVLAALAYDAAEAARLGQDLYTFMTGGTTVVDPNVDATADLIAQTNAQGRLSVVLGVEWLGPYLVLPLLFAGAYALARIPGLDHRRAVTAAAPLAVVACVVLPWLASDVGDRTVGPLDPSRPAALLVTLALVVPIWLARHCPAERAPSRRVLARLVVWAAPTLLAWEQVAPYNARYVAGVWVPLVLLIASAFWMAALGTAARSAASRRAPAAGAAVLALALALAVVDLRNFDALGARPDGSINAARFVADIGWGGWFDAERARAAADPQLGGMLAATRAAAGPHGRVFTNDGRFGFFFGGRARVGLPPTCASTRPYAAVALLLNVLAPLSESRYGRLSPAARDVLRRGRADPGLLERCGHLRRIAGAPGSFVVFARV